MGLEGLQPKPEDSQAASTTAQNQFDEARLRGKLDGKGGEAIALTEVSKDLPVGVTRVGDSYRINLATFDATKCDLAKFDLSKGINSFEFDASEIDKREYNKEIDKDTHAIIDNIITKSNNALMRACEHKVYKDYPTLCKSVLGIFIYCKKLKMMAKAHLNSDILYRQLRNANGQFVGELISKNQEAFNKAEREKREKADLERESDPNLPGDDIHEVSNENFELKSLFSGDETERTIAHEMVVTRAYYDLWHKYGMKQPDTENFNTNYVRAEGILATNIKGLNPHERGGLLNTIQEVNRSLREEAKALAQSMAQDKPKDSAKANIDQKDLNPFQLALRDVMARTRTLNDWAKNWGANYTRWFDLDESWVQKGMEKLGIKEEDIIMSYQTFLTSDHAHNILVDVRGNPVNRLAYDCSPDELVQTHEELIRASADLNYVQQQLKPGIPVEQQLKDGIPVESIPDCINGLQRKPTSHKKNICLLDTWMQLTTNWDKDKRKKEAEKWRRILIKKMSKRLKSLNERIIPAKEGEVASSTEQLSLLISERDTLEVNIPEVEEEDMLEQEVSERLKSLNERIIPAKEREVASSTEQLSLLI